MTLCPSLHPGRHISDSTARQTLCELHRSSRSRGKCSSAGALASVMVHGPAVCEHCIAPQHSCSPAGSQSGSPSAKPELAALFRAVQEWEAWLSACETSAPEGFIAARRTGMENTRSSEKTLHHGVRTLATVPVEAWQIAITVRPMYDASGLIVGEERGRGEKHLDVYLPVTLAHMDW